MIGEDEANGLPSQYITLLGFEAWGAAPGSPRWVAEYADTTAGSLIGSPDRPGSAYNHSVYTDGYRYRGRAIGHSADGDSRLTSLGLILPGTDWSLSAFASWGELNRSQQALHTALPVNGDVVQLRTNLSWRSRWGEWSAGIAGLRIESVSGNETDVRGEIGWRLI